jgi:hypothetical protein
MSKTDKEIVNEIAETFLPSLEDENPVEIKNYHATNKKIWETSGQDKEDTVCAKSIKYIKSGVTRFYIKRLGCSFFDPGNISPIYKRQLWRFGPVSETAFRMYLDFLGFGNPTFKGHQYLKTRAERLV